jgi:dipeptidyl aminopeptidase/acylaminoacyl peptidase
MLNFYGASNVRCKVADGNSIVAAMQAKSIRVTYAVYPDEGHGFQKPPNAVVHGHRGGVLWRHLGGACEPFGRDFDGSSHEVRAGVEILLEFGAR